MSLVRQYPITKHGDTKVETHEEARFLDLRWDPPIGNFERGHLFALALVDTALPPQWRRLRVVATEEHADGLVDATYVGSHGRIHVFDLGPCAAPGEDPPDDA